jgi:hypothetical protein
MPITRTPIIDDDGSNTTGTVFENAWKQEFYDQIDAAMAGFDIGKTGTSTVYTSSGGNITTPPGQIRYVQFTSATPITVYSVTGGNIGDMLILHNMGSGVVSLAFSQWNVQGGFYNLVTTGPTQLATGGSAIYMSQGAGIAWYIISHEQGAPISSPFAANNFWSSNGTWSVTSGALLNMSYYLRGRELTIDLVITAQPLSVAAAILYIHSAAYGNYQTNINRETAIFGVSGGTNIMVRALSGPVWSATTHLQFYPLASGTTWTAGSCAPSGNVKIYVS